MKQPKPSPARPSKAKPTKPVGPRSKCPINLVLEMVGDSWSLLILRDMMLKGHKSYQAFLHSPEGIATNILADRLVKLESNGLITKGPDPSDARKFIYALNEKGADLAPLLVEMIEIGQKHHLIIDMPKEILEQVARSKPLYAKELSRAHRPKVKQKPARTRQEKEETLNLFDDF